MTDATADDGGLAVTRFEPGSNVLVVDEDGDAGLPFCLSRPEASGGVAVVTTDHTGASVADAAAEYLADGARLDVVDCSGESTAAGVPGAASVTAAGPDVPSVGEAAVDAIQATEATDVTTLAVGSLSTLVERSTVQQVYKLLYLLGQQVRARDLVAFYRWDGHAGEKTLRILGQALDHLVSLDGRDVPTVRSPSEW